MNQKNSHIPLEQVYFICFTNMFSFLPFNFFKFSQLSFYYHSLYFISVSLLLYFYVDYFSFFYMLTIRTFLKKFNSVLMFFFYLLLTFFYFSSAFIFSLLHSFPRSNLIRHSIFILFLFRLEFYS